MGLLDRHGPDKCSKVRTKVVENVRRGTLQTEVRQQVEPGTNVYTDALRSYEGLSAEFVHAVVDHAECYAKGNVHTNGLENFWSLFKRCIKGTHVSVEPLHLFRYLDSECFRFNNRDLDDGRRFMLSLQGVSSKRLTYKSLTGALEERLQSESTAGNAAHPD
jgi:transposase-like protein